jgi:hypothetical protein
MYYHIIHDDFECEGFTRLETFTDYKSANQAFVKLWNSLAFYIDEDGVEQIYGDSDLDLTVDTSYGSYGVSYANFCCGSSKYWLLKSDYDADQLDFLCKENNMWDDSTDREIALKPEWEHTPGEGYDVFDDVSKSARLRYPKQVSELKIHLMEKKFILFGREELRLRKQYARRASRRQNKKMVRDFL